MFITEWEVLAENGIVNPPARKLVAALRPGD